MQWQEFKQLPGSCQSDYIRSLIQSYGVTAKCIAEMLGVSAETFSRFLQTNHPDITFQRGHRMSKGDLANWHAFQYGAEAKVPEEEVAVPEQAQDCTAAEFEKPQMLMDAFSLRFSGEIDLDMIFNSIQYILGNNYKHGEIEIRCYNLTTSQH